MRAGSLDLRRDDGALARGYARELADADVDAVFALHRRLVSGLPGDLVATETHAFFADHIALRGRMFGLFVADALVAYAVLGLPRAGDANFGGDHRLAPVELARVAHLDGAGVDPRYRGNGLQQRLIRWRIDAARAAGRVIILSTVAPANAVSVDNMFACGLSVRGLAVRFGGWRYLLRRDLDIAAVAAKPGRWVGAGKLETQRGLLEAGWRGWCARTAGAREILFAKACEQAVDESRCQREAGASAGGVGEDDGSGTASPNHPISRQ